MFSLLFTLAAIFSEWVNYALDMRINWPKCCLILKCTHRIQRVRLRTNYSHLLANCKCDTSGFSCTFEKFICIWRKIIAKFVHTGIRERLIIEKLSSNLIFFFSFRNPLNNIHKIRRHLNDQVRANLKPTNGIKGIMNRPTWSSSQLSIEVSDLHADGNGRLEISCASTIPAKLLQQDEYADFRIYSVKSKFIKLFKFIKSFKLILLMFWKISSSLLTQVPRQNLLSLKKRDS